MVIFYKTVMQEAEVEQTIEKSRFIGYIKPVETKEDAEEFIKHIKGIHKNATHNVPAYVIGPKSQFQWSSEDGEPAGTSGAPMLHMLVKQGITNVVVVVTRYFGGIKLGTGGLMRAYTGVLKQALEAAEVCGVKEKHELSLRLDYTHYGKLQNMSRSGDFLIKDAGFTDLIDLILETDIDKTAAVIGQITEMTGGVCKEENVEVKKILSKYKV